MHRQCPGDVLADASIWLVSAYAIATFDLSPPVDEQGKVVPPSGDFVSGFVRYGVAVLHWCV